MNLKQATQRLMEGHPVYNHQGKRFRYNEQHGICINGKIYISPQEFIEQHQTDEFLDGWEPKNARTTG